MAIEKEEHDPSLGLQVTPVHVGGDSLLDRLVPHIKKVALALVAAAVVLTVFFLWRWWQHREAEQATEHLARALELGDRAVIPLDMDLGDKMPEHYKSQADRAQATLGELGKAGEVRDAAALYEAQILVQAGKLDEALARYRRLGGAAGLDGAIAREGVGVVLETQAAAAKDPAQRQKLLEEALAAFRAVQADDKGPRRDYALYHEARMLEAMGKPGDAVAPLKKALVVAPESALRSVIEMRLSALGASEGT